MSRYYASSCPLGAILATTNEINIVKIMVLEPLSKLFKIGK